MKKIVTSYLLVFSIVTSVYLVLFYSPIAKTQTILFYRGLYLLGPSLLITVLCLVLIHRKTTFISMESAIAGVVAGISINLCIFVILPVTFDRSVTMYMLKTLEKEQRKSYPLSKQCIQGGVSKEKITNQLIDEYINNSDAVGRRIEEQQFTGTVTNRNGCISLTSQGKWFLSFSRIIQGIYGIK